MYKDIYRKTPAYKEFRKAVIERDKGRCRIPGCKYRGKKIQVHHISMFSTSINLRYEPRNGICLCPSCHHMVTGKEYYYSSLLNSIVNGEYDK